MHKKASSTPTYVYFIGYSDLNAAKLNPVIKIGVTNNIYYRLGELQTGSPYRLTCIASIELPTSHAAYILERELHDALSQHRSYGEWFYLSNELLTLVKRYPETYDTLRGFMKVLKVYKRG